MIRYLKRGFESFLRTNGQGRIEKVLDFQIHHVGADTILVELLPSIKSKVEERKEEEYCQSIEKIVLT